MAAPEAFALIRKHYEASGLTQTTIAHEISRRLGRHYTQGQVSDHLKGERLGKDAVALSRAYAEVLNISETELLQAWGWPAKRGPRPPTLEAIIKADNGLTRSAKRHLLKQYELLLMASQVERNEQGSTPDQPTSKKRETG